MSVRRKVKRMKVYDGRKTPSDGNSHDRWPDPFTES
jgi:hypothetical protein